MDPVFVFLSTYVMLATGIHTSALSPTAEEKGDDNASDLLVPKKATVELMRQTPAQSETQVPNITFFGESTFVSQDLPLGESTFVSQDLPLRESTPVSQDLPLGESSPVSQDLPLGESSPVSQDLPLGESSPVSQDLPLGELTSVSQDLSLPSGRQLHPEVVILQSSNPRVQQRAVPCRSSNPGVQQGGVSQPSNPGVQQGRVSQSSNPGVQQGGVSQPSNPGVQQGRVSQSSNPGVQQGRVSQSSNPGVQQGRVSQSSNPGVQQGRVSQSSNPGVQQGRVSQSYNPGVQQGRVSQSSNPGVQQGRVSQSSNPGVQQGRVSQSSNPGVQQGRVSQSSNPGVQQGRVSQSSNPGVQQGRVSQSSNPGVQQGRVSQSSNPGVQQGRVSQSSNPGVQQGRVSQSSNPGVQQNEVLQGSSTPGVQQATLSPASSNPDLQQGGVLFRFSNPGGQQRAVLSGSSHPWLQTAISTESFNAGEGKQAVSTESSNRGEGKQAVSHGFSNPGAEKQAISAESSNPGEGKQAVSHGFSNPGAEKQAISTESSNPGAEKQAISTESCNPGAEKQAVSTESSNPGAEKQAISTESSNPGAEKQAISTESSNPGAEKQTVSRGFSNPGAEKQAVSPGFSNPGAEKQTVSPGFSNPGAEKQTVSPGFSNPRSPTPGVQQRPILPPPPHAHQQAATATKLRTRQAAPAQHGNAVHAAPNLPQYPQLPAGQRVFKYVNLSLKAVPGYALVSWDIDDPYLVKGVTCTLITEYIGVGDCAVTAPAQRQETPLDQLIRSYELRNVVAWSTLAVTLKGETLTQQVDHMTATVTTHEQRTVTNIRTVSLQPDSAQLAWEPPACEQRGGRLKRYTIKLTPTAAVQKFMSLTSTSESLFMKNLDPFTEYQAVIAYVNSLGSGPESQPYTFKTSQGPPSPPLVYNFTYDDVSIGIVIVQPLQPHGPVEEYQVQLADGPTGLSNLFTPLKDTEYVIGKLRPNTTYSIKARARNAAGWGEWSHTIYVTTKEEARPIPQAVKQSFSNATCIGFYWVPPVSDVNAVSSYKIIVATNDQTKQRFDSTVDKSTHSFMQCGLTQHTLYSVTVSVMKDSGRLGQPLGARMWTESMVPPAPRQPVVRETTSSTITAEISPVYFDHGPITAYEIRLLELHHNHSKHTGHQLDPLNDPELQDNGMPFSTADDYNPAGPTISPTSPIRNRAQEDNMRMNGPFLQPAGKRSTRVTSKHRRIANRELQAAEEPANNYRLIVIALPDSLAIQGHNFTQIKAWTQQWLKQPHSKLHDHSTPALNHPDVNLSGSDVFHETGNDVTYRNGNYHKSSTGALRPVGRTDDKQTYLHKSHDHRQFPFKSNVIKEVPVTDSGTRYSGELENMSANNTGIEATAGGTANNSSALSYHHVARRNRRTLSNPPGVMWLELPASDVTEPTPITLGDDKLYHGRRNLPLKSDTEYAVVYVVKSTVVDVTKHSFAYAKVTAYTQVEEKDEGDDDDLWLIVIIVVGVILLALFLLLGFFVIRYLIMRRRRAHGSNDDDQFSDEEDNDEEESDNTDDYDDYRKPLQVKGSTDFGRTPMKNTSDLETFFNPIHSLGQPRYINSMRDNVRYSNNTYSPNANGNSAGDATNNVRNNDGNNSAVKASTTSTSDGTSSARDSDPSVLHGAGGAVIDTHTSQMTDLDGTNHCCCSYPRSAVSCDSSMTCDICSSIVLEQFPECTKEIPRLVNVSGYRCTQQGSVGANTVECLHHKPTNSSSKLAVSSQQLAGSADLTIELSDTTESLSLCSVNESISSDIFEESSNISTQRPRELRPAPVRNRDSGFVSNRMDATDDVFSTRSTSTTGQGCSHDNNLDPNRVNDLAHVLFNRNNSHHFEEEDVIYNFCQETAATSSGCRMNTFCLQTRGSMSKHNPADSSHAGCSLVPNLADSSHAGCSLVPNLADSSYAGCSLVPNLADSSHAGCSLVPNLADSSHAGCSLFQNLADSSHAGCSLVPNLADSSHAGCSLFQNLADSSHAGCSLATNLADSSHANCHLVPNLAASSHANCHLVPNLADSSHAGCSLVPNLADSSHAGCSLATNLADSSHAGCSLVPNLADSSHANCHLVPNLADSIHAGCNRVFNTQEKTKSPPTVCGGDSADSCGYLHGDANSCGYLHGDANSCGYLHGDANSCGYLHGDANLCGYLHGEADLCEYLHGDANLCGYLHGDANLSRYSHSEGSIGQVRRLIAAHTRSKDGRLGTNHYPTSRSISSKSDTFLIRIGRHQARSTSLPHSEKHYCNINTFPSRNVDFSKSHFTTSLPNNLFSLAINTENVNKTNMVGGKDCYNQQHITFGDCDTESNRRANMTENNSETYACPTPQENVTAVGNETMNNLISSNNHQYYAGLFSNVTCQKKDSERNESRADCRVGESAWSLLEIFIAGNDCDDDNNTIIDDDVHQQGNVISDDMFNDRDEHTNGSKQPKKTKQEVNLTNATKYNKEFDCVKEREEWVDERELLSAVSESLNCLNGVSETCVSAGNCVSANIRGYTCCTKDDLGGHQNTCLAEDCVGASCGLAITFVLCTQVLINTDKPQVLCMSRTHGVTNTDKPQVLCISRTHGVTNTDKPQVLCISRTHGVTNTDKPQVLCISRTHGVTNTDKPQVLCISRTHGALIATEGISRTQLQLVATAGESVPVGRLLSGTEQQGNTGSKSSIVNIHHVGSTSTNQPNTAPIVETQSLFDVCHTAPHTAPRGDTRPVLDAGNAIEEFRQRTHHSYYAAKAIQVDPVCINSDVSRNRFHIEGYIDSGSYTNTNTRTTDTAPWMVDRGGSCECVYEDVNNNSSNNKNGSRLLEENMRTAFDRFNDEDDDIEDIVLDRDIQQERVDVQEEEKCINSQEKQDNSIQIKYTNVDSEDIQTSHDDSEDDISSIYSSDKNENNSSSEEEAQPTKDGDNDSSKLNSVKQCKHLMTGRTSCSGESKLATSQENLGISSDNQKMLLEKSSRVYDIQDGGRTQTKGRSEHGLPVNLALNHCDQVQIHERRSTPLSVGQAPADHQVHGSRHDSRVASSLVKTNELCGRKAVKFMFTRGDGRIENSAMDNSLFTTNSVWNTNNKARKVPPEIKSHRFGLPVPDRTFPVHELKGSDPTCTEDDDTMSTTGSAYESSSSAGLLPQGHRSPEAEKHSVKKRWFHVFHRKKHTTKQEAYPADTPDKNPPAMNSDKRNSDISSHDVKEMNNNKQNRDIKEMNNNKQNRDISDRKSTRMRKSGSTETEKQGKDKRMKRNIFSMFVKDKRMKRNIFSMFVKDNDENENKPRDGRGHLLSQRGRKDSSRLDTENSSRLSHRPRAGTNLRPTSRPGRAGRAVTFKDEFRALERYRHHVMRSMRFDTALGHPDRNRFSHIHPPDHSRVNVEITSPGDSDYYNASYMTLNSDIRYIAAQSPFSPPTVGDFWRLVLQNGVETVVMMTQCVEWGVVKCLQYWADSGVFADGPVIVQTVGHQQYADFAIRTLKVSSSTSPEVTVTHFQFQTWPFTDVPDDPVPLLDLRYRVRRSHGNKDTPILVHCDSGSAQSAVFIAVDLLIEQYGQDGSVNVYGFVKKLRKSRPSMVRSLGQYRFIYECLFEEFQAGDTVLRLDLAEKYATLCAMNPQTGFSYLMDEYRMLSAFTPDIHPRACAAGLEPENAMKNADRGIVPPDFYRPYLNVRGSPATDGYINAVFVDGLHRRHEFLVTQTPLNSTVYAFWRMVYDYQVQAIVQLGTFTGYNQAQYIPLTGSRRFEYLLVELVNMAVQGSVTVRNLKLCVDMMAGVEKRAVRHFQVEHWEGDDTMSSRKMESSPNSHTEIIELIDLVMTWQTVANRRTRPIVVCCTNGAANSGLFCCSVMLCERLKEDNEVDLYHTVKHIKRRRPQFVADFDQYQFLYVVLLEYIDNFLNNEGEVLDGGEGTLSSRDESNSDNCVKDLGVQTELDCVSRDVRDASCGIPDVLICYDDQDLKSPRAAITAAGCRERCQSVSAGVHRRSPVLPALGAAGAGGCACETTHVQEVFTGMDDAADEDCWENLCSCDCFDPPVCADRHPAAHQRSKQLRESPRFQTRREGCSPAQTQTSRPRYRTKLPVCQESTHIDNYGNVNLRQRQSSPSSRPQRLQRPHRPHDYSAECGQSLTEPQAGECGCTQVITTEDSTKLHHSSTRRLGSGQQQEDALFHSERQRQRGQKCVHDVHLSGKCPPLADRQWPERDSGVFRSQKMETQQPGGDPTSRVADCSPCAPQRQTSVRLQPSAFRPHAIAEGRRCTETLVEKCYFSPTNKGETTSPCTHVCSGHVSPKSPVNYFDESSSPSEFDVSLNLV